METSRGPEEARESSPAQARQEFLDGKLSFDNLAVQLMRKEGEDLEGNKTVHSFAVQYNLRAQDHPDTEIEILYRPGDEKLWWGLKELTRGEDGIYRPTGMPVDLGIAEGDVRSFLHSDNGRTLLAGNLVGRRRIVEATSSAKKVEIGKEGHEKISNTAQLSDDPILHRKFQFPTDDLDRENLADQRTREQVLHNLEVFIQRSLESVHKR